MLADTFSPEVAAARSTPAPRRSTTSAAAPTRCSSWSPSAAAATCSCTSRARRGSTGRRPAYDDPVAHLLRVVRRAARARRRRSASTASRSRSIPGLDFDLTTDDDLELLRRLGELRALGRPLFVALSRKDFLGAVLAGSWEERLAADEREAATLAATALAVAGGRRGAAPPRRRPRSTRCAPPAAIVGRPAVTDARRRPAARLGAAARGGRDRRAARRDQRRAAPREPDRCRRRPSSRPELRRRSRAPGSTASTRTRSRRSTPRGAGDVIVTSGTASGKSLSFNLPVLDAIARDPKARALYLYPTKALAQDQARKLSELGLAELRHAIYDGDTPREDRPAIRRRSNLVLTNPDMLNMGVLAHHKGWGDFLANLELGRRRRGAHLPRRLRLARRQRPAAAAARGPRLRLRAALRPRLGDDRQPGRARRARSPAPSSRSSTPTAPRAPGGGSRSGTRR